VLSFVFLIFLLVLIVCDLVVSLRELCVELCLLDFFLVLIVHDLVVSVRELCVLLCLLGFSSGSDCS
jgi:hypothetical protein